MFLGLLFAIVFMVLFVQVVTWIIRLGYVFTAIIDIIVIGGILIYYGHNEWFIYIASGKAVYFWDVVSFVLISFIYGAIIVFGTSKFPRIAGLFHYVIAWVTTGFIYIFINYGVFGNKLGMLLNNEQMNTVVHIVIISILALFISRTRMRIFRQDLT